MEGLNSKLTSLIIKNEHNESEAAIMIPKQEQFSYISKLPIELLVKIFDFLALKDLHAVCQTSKLWQEVAFYCYQQNYSATRTSDYNSSSLSKYVLGRYLFIENEPHRDIKMDAFISKIQSYYFNMTGGFVNNFQYFLEFQSKFEMLKILSFDHADFTNIKIESMKEILGKVEWLQLTACRISGFFIAYIVSSYPNIKSLSLYYNYGGELHYLIRPFPNLERIAIKNYRKGENFPLCQVLRCNPNIRRLAVGSNLIFNNDDLVRGPPITLDELNIEIDPFIAPWIYQLNKLQEIGFYKRLKVHCNMNMEMNQDTLDKMALVNPIKLHLGVLQENLSIKLSSWRTIHELCALGTRDITDLDEIARNFENLESIFFGVTTLSHVMLFIKQTKRLSKFRIDYLQVDGKKEKEKIIDLSLLNSERKKLTGARKITLYVEEELFLATKWANQEIDLDFIQLKRIDSYNWDRDFDTFHDFVTFDAMKVS